MIDDDDLYLYQIEWDIEEPEPEPEIVDHDTMWDAFRGPES